MEILDRVEEPSKIKEFIEESKSRKRTITVIAECEVEYEGRAASDLAAGERIIILKPDGVIAVHKDEQLRPVNWQPAGSELSVYIKDDIPWLESYRTNPTEVLTVALKNVHSITAKKLRDNSELELTGTEDDVVEKILDNPSLITDNFRILDTEKETGAGPVDIYGKYKDGIPVFVEVKTGTVNPSNVMQLHRYIEAAEDNDGEDDIYDGIIVGSEISDRASNVLERKNFEFISIEPDRTVDRKKKTTLNDF